MFPYADPSVTDFLAICGGGRIDRQKVRVWKHKPSDVDGCLNLFESEVVKPTLPLGHNECPALALVDALTAKGFTPSSKKCTHAAGTPNTYYDGNLYGKRSYLQCLLALEELLSRGVLSFDSAQPAAFYRLMLRLRGPVPEGLGAKAYLKRLAEFHGDVVHLKVLEDIAPIAGRAALPSDRRPGPRPAKVAKLATDIAGGSEDDEPAPCGDDVVAPVAAPAPDDVAGGDEGGAKEKCPADFPTDIQGVAVSWVAGKCGGGWSYHPRLKVCCPNAMHPGCQKSRSIELDTAVFGDQSPILYLEAWLAKSHSQAHKAHSAWRPSRKDIQAYLDSRDL